MARFFNAINQQKAQQKSPQYILVLGIYQTSPVHQIERNLRYDRPKEQPSQILFQIAGVDIALHQQKGKDGVSKPAYPSEPCVLGKDGRPKMVAQHKKHGNDMECKGTDALKSSIFLLRRSALVKYPNQLHDRDFLLLSFSQCCHHPWPIP